jgi:flavin reductase (DIM6/NTAB) family NADH-FMN oxidoreductase RutF
MTDAGEPSDLQPRRLRDAFGCFSTGVTVVSAYGPGGAAVGLTANSFTSVSLDPPLVLFCLDRRSRRAPAFEAAPAFAVNVLHAGQEGVSKHFARGGTDDEGASFIEWSGTPVLADAMAVFACRRHAVHDGGDHLVLIGRVERVRSDPRQDPLLYFQGRYRSVHVPE